MSKEMSRRDLLKMGGLAAAGVAGASFLGGCAPKAASSASGSGKAANGGSTATTTAAGHERAGLPSFLSNSESNVHGRNQAKRLINRNGRGRNP